MCVCVFWVLGSQPQAVVFGLVGGESLAGGAKCSSCLCQKPGAPPGEAAPFHPSSGSLSLEGGCVRESKPVTHSPPLQPP